MVSDLQTEVEELASLQFSKDEILTIVGEDKELEDIWIKRGRLKAIAEVRKSILSQARQGSSPAQKEYMNLIKALEISKKIDYDKLKWDIAVLVFGKEDKDLKKRKDLVSKLSVLSVSYE